MMIYRQQIYNIPADGKLGYRYSYDNFASIERLLLEGGIRLAGVLIQINGEGAKSLLQAEAFSLKDASACRRLGIFN